MNQRKLNALLEKGGYLHYFLHKSKQYRLDLLGLGNAPLSSKSLSLDLDSPSTFWMITLDRDSLELKSLSLSSRLFSFSSSCKFLKSSLAWSAVSLWLLSLATAKLCLQIHVDLHNVFKFWSFYRKTDSKDEQLYWKHEIIISASNPTFGFTLVRLNSEIILSKQPNPRWKVASSATSQALCNRMLPPSATSQKVKLTAKVRMSH